MTNLLCDLVPVYLSDLISCCALIAHMGPAVAPPCQAYPHITDFEFIVPFTWNALAQDFHTASCFSSFKSSLIFYFFTRAFPETPIESYTLIFRLLLHFLFLLVFITNWNFMYLVFSYLLPHQTFSPQGSSLYFSYTFRAPPRPAPLPRTVRSSRN